MNGVAYDRAPTFPISPAMERFDDGALICGQMRVQTGAHGGASSIRTARISGRGNSDMLLRDANTGGLQVYNIANNQITGSTSIGTVGLDWQFSGVGNFSSVPDESDLLLRNVNPGGLEVLNINNNQVTGSAFLATIGLDWQFAGVPSAPPARPTWSCATSTPAHSKSTTSPIIN
jgi:hypothetical protein